MANECDVSKIVTTFLLNTCRLPPCPSHRDVEAAIHCAKLAFGHPNDKEEIRVIPLTTGSMAEFYIKPMLPHVGDIDVMYHHDNMLAIPRGHPPPTQLPAEFHNYAQVFEIIDRVPDIIDSHFPGYVYLELRYLLTECTDDDNYNAVEYDRGRYAANISDNPTYFIHGPAVCQQRGSDTMFPIDVVCCVRCLSWPPQAAYWPTRRRNYGWPDSATLDRVVSNGCDLVGVAHRQCRQHEWMGKCQWRLSFSRAEIVLINSWMPVQQIVYHMLRYFIKTERLTDCADNSGAGTLSNYHIKTLMLWASELKPRSWWTENLNLVRICVELLNTLSAWLTDTRCPHYFISNCNLLDKSFNVESVASILISIDEEYLSKWFVKNYIGQCAQLCPSYIVRLFCDVDTSMQLQNAVSKIVHWRLNNPFYDWWLAVDLAESAIPAMLPVALKSLNVRSCGCWMKELAKVDKRFSVYFSAVVLLHVARRISGNGSSDELMDIVATVLGHNTNNSSSVLFSLRNNELNASELVEIVQKSALEHLITYRQLIARDLGSVVTFVTTDFEALYAYKRGDYQRCLQFTQNVHTLLYARIPLLRSIPLLSDFIQLFDDDIVSLTAMTLIVNPECREVNSDERCPTANFCTNNGYAYISQLTLSLYLMIQCQLKLHHPVTSLAQTLDYIEVAHVRHPRERVLDQLTLKLIERNVHRTISR